MTRQSERETERPTRYAELGYRHDGRNLWRIVVMEDGAAVGPQYASKAELLADLARFAAVYGCADANPAPAEPERCGYVDPATDRVCVLAPGHMGIHSDGAR